MITCSRWSLLSIGFSALLLTACATSYQSVGFTGGFTETQLSENVWRVNFSGNAYTRAERASDFAMLRAAELCNENGYTYLYVTDFQSYSNIFTYTTPQTARTTTYGTFDAATYGNVTSGTFNANSTTTYSGGQTYTFTKPRTDIIAVCSTEPIHQIQAMPYEANFIESSIRGKYKME